MKKTMNGLLSILLSVCVCGCSSTTSVGTEETMDSSTTTEQETVSEGTNEEIAVTEEETVDDPAWDTLNSLGMVETENGLFYVNLSLPADLVGEDVTQESLDANAGENYTSAKLNSDGSVTYKMTKKQHRTMLDTMKTSFEESLSEMVSNGDYAVSEITHNDDFTSFDVKLTGEEMGFAEYILVMGLYMIGGMYGVFTGKQSDIKVNFYSVTGELIETANSADMEE